MTHASFRMKTAFFSIAIYSAMAQADQWGPVQQTEFASRNGEYIVKIDPDKTRFSRPGSCKADLIRIRDGTRKVIWSRYLINNHAPVRIYVADSGHYVVTMDEWHHVGKFPVVIYDRLGGLVEVHNCESLGLMGEDIIHIKQSVSSFWWNENALVFFGPQDDTLIIRLHWGKFLVIDLNSGTNLTRDFFGKGPRGKFLWKEKWSTLERFIDEESKKQVLSLLQSDDPKDMETGAIHAGQLGAIEAKPYLRELLTNEAAYAKSASLSKVEKVFFVREAARKALEAMGETVEDVPVGEKRTTTTQPSTRPSI